MRIKTRRSRFSPMLTAYLEVNMGIAPKKTLPSGGISSCPKLSSTMTLAVSSNANKPAQKFYATLSSLAKAKSSKWCTSYQSMAVKTLVPYLVAVNKKVERRKTRSCTKPRLQWTHQTSIIWATSMEWRPTLSISQASQLSRWNN